MKLHGDSGGYAKRFEFVVRILSEQFANPDPNTISVLDIGCGNGSYLSRPLASLGFAVLGIDPHHPSIEHAMTMAPPRNCAFRCCRVEELPPASKFSCVILSEVLEHLPDPDAMLHAAVARIGEGGIIIVTVPNGYGEAEIDKKVFRRLNLERAIAPFRRYRDVGPASSDNMDGHVQFFTQSSLKRLFVKERLKIVAQQSSTLACGPLASYMLGRLPRAILRWNERVTDYLPMALASGWYFALRLD
jgi:SAM-dependent methyltransferase